MGATAEVATAVGEVEVAADMVGKVDMVVAAKVAEGSVGAVKARVEAEKVMGEVAKGRAEEEMALGVRVAAEELVVSVGPKEVLVVAVVCMQD